MTGRDPPEPSNLGLADGTVGVVALTRRPSVKLNIPPITLNNHHAEQVAVQARSR